MVDVVGGAWIHPVSVTAWTLSLLLAGGARIWPVACGSGRWREDVVPHERDGAVIAIFLFSLFSIIGAHSRSSQVMFVIGDANTWHAYLIWLWARLGWVFLM
jgi:hypothetical protein